MKNLLLLTAVIALMLPAPALSEGNVSPHLFLEIYDFPSDPDPVPEYVCTCSLDPPALLQCFSDKNPDLAFGLLAVHVGQIEHGYHGLPFGIATSGGDAIFLGTVACPGFNREPSAIGEPEAIMFSTTGDCHQWRSHAGYVKYLTQNTTATFFDIVASADLGHNWVINCDGEYDQGTVVGGRAQWGGSQSVSCQGDPVPVELGTWSKIKGLFR